MTAVYLPWAAEFILETAGAVLNFRRSRTLSALLAVCAIGDAVTFILFQTTPRMIYAWSYWAQRSIKYIFLLWLACTIAGKFVGEENEQRVKAACAFLSLLAASVTVVVLFQGVQVREQLLWAEIVANFFLLLVCYLGWMTRRERLSEEWRWITAGFLLMVGSDVLFTLWWSADPGGLARHLYPAGAIPALMIWAAAPLRSKRWPKFTPRARAAAAHGNDDLLVLD